MASEAGFDMTETQERWTYINGEWKPEAAAYIHIYDSHFMFGDAVFEMHRTFGHQHFLLDEHIDRLWASMRHAQIEPNFTRRDLYALCDEAIRRNRFDHDEEYRFMINVSRGPLSIYHEVFDIGHRGTNLIVNVWPLSKTAKTLAHFYDEPADARVVTQRQIPSHLLDARVKNRSRMHYKLADLEAAEHGPKAIPLLLDDQGYVCESSGANFAIVKNGTLIVPEPRNMLFGCSMQFLLRLARDMQIPVVERNMHVYDVENADEAFFTGTFYNMIPCGKLNGRPIGNHRDGRPNVFPRIDDCMGRYTRMLAAAWNQHVFNKLIWTMSSNDPHYNRIMKTICTDEYDRWNSTFDFVKQIRLWAEMPRPERYDARRG